MEYCTLNNGVKLPLLGYGTFATHEEECRSSVLDAIETGYRLIDTAEAYGNEEAVGRAIAQCGIPREDLFLTTKVNFPSYENATAAVETSMRKLGVDYLDLVLLHWPFGNYYAAWRTLEQFYAEGRVRAIGISNFNPDRMIDLIHFNQVIPAVNQIETHPECQRLNEHVWMEKYGVSHQAYAPLGRGGKYGILEHPVLQEIASAHGKTPAQVALRMNIQRGVSVIPKSSRPERIQENFDIFDFTLNEQEMSQLTALNQEAARIGTPERPEKVEVAMTW